MLENALQVRLTLLNMIILFKKDCESKIVHTWDPLNEYEGRTAVVEREKCSQGKIINLYK